jgi:hypothetical protein
VDHVYAPPKAEGQVVRSERTLRRHRIVSLFEKLLGGLFLAVAALGMLGAALEMEAFDSDAALGVAVVTGLGLAFLGCGFALRRGYTWPQYPLFGVSLLLGVMIAIGSTL